MEICRTCRKTITGVEKYDSELVYCFKCFRIIEKAKRKIKEEERKNWYNPSWTDDEYFHYVYDHFC